MEHILPESLVGFACKVCLQDVAQEKRFHFKTTTLKLLSALTKEEKISKLCSIYDHNIVALSRLLYVVERLPPPLRMLRLSGDLFPYVGMYPELGQYAYSLSLHPDVHPDNIRLSFHPSQFISLGTGFSESCREDLYNHEDIIFNVLHCSQYVPIVLHVGSRRTTKELWMENWRSLRDSLRERIVLENDEFSWGLDALVTQFSEHVPIVPDLHHDWVFTAGAKRDPEEQVFSDVLQSWERVGTKPKMHLSTPRSSLELRGGGWLHLSPEIEYEFSELQAFGVTKTELRKHADYLALDQWTNLYRQFYGRFDFMVEMKSKNGASFEALNALTSGTTQVDVVQCNSSFYKVPF